jgi:hypothetical protein
MSKKAVVLFTLIVWLSGTSVYTYWWVMSILADPATVGYERELIFPLSGFLVYRGIYLFLGIVVVIWAELMLYETVFKKTRESGARGKHSSQVARGES